MAWILVVVAAAGGWASTRLGLRLATRTLTRPPHVRRNYRDRDVIATLGLVLVLPAGFGALVAIVIDWTAAVIPATVAGTGFALAGLGLLDDLSAEAQGGGFAGHLKALRHGRVTSGLVKAAGGGILGLAAAAGLGQPGWWVLAGGAVVALSANLANLFDLRPGRTCKLWLVAFALWHISGPSMPLLASVWGAAGGVVAFVPSDLGERGMLGDTGANLLGGILGVAVVASVDGAALLGVLGVLAALNLASEVVSFSRVIEAVPPLRAADRWGREAYRGGVGPTS